jgi:hypothetical protein
MFIFIVFISRSPIPRRNRRVSTKRAVNTAVDHCLWRQLLFFRLLFPYGLSEISRSIGKALSFDTDKGAIRAGHIVNAELHAVRIAEIEFH